MEMNLENIMEEVKVYDFCEEAESKAVKQENKEKNMEEKKNVKVHSKTNKVVESIKTNTIVKKFKADIAKNIALMAVTAVCAYFKLMSPILYIPIEIACLCAVSYKIGEWKGSVANG